MTKDKMDNFLDRLSPDVMKRILWDFWDWMNEEGCPLERDSQYPCEWRESDEYSSSKEPAFDCPYGQTCGCWVKYYAWKHGVSRSTEED